MRFSRGFSFIELMIVIAIIAFMASLLLASFLGERNESSLEAAVRDVAASIRMAQNHALSGYKKGIVAGTRKLCWIEFSKVSSSDTNYEIFVRSIPSSNENCSLSTVDNSTRENFVLSNEVQFGKIPWNSGGNFIRFGIPWAYVSPSETSTLCLERNNQHIFVSVNASGVVTESAVSKEKCP